MATVNPLPLYTMGQYMSHCVHDVASALLIHNPIIPLTFYSYGNVSCVV